MKQYYARSANTACREVLGEAVILRLPEGEMFVLNASGSVLWALLDGTRTCAQVLADFSAAYGLNNCPEAENFLAALTEAGLVALGEAKAGRDVAQYCSSAPAAYLPPEIRTRELVETLAGICISGYTGEPDQMCQTIGVGCFDAYD
jgi:hypothetical protein